MKGTIFKTDYIRYAITYTIL